MEIQKSGKSLLRLANSMIKRNNGNADITALHLTPTNELHHFNAEEYENESFRPILTEIRKFKSRNFHSFQSLFKYRFRYIRNRQ